MPLSAWPRCCGRRLPAAEHPAKPAGDRSRAAIRAKATRRGAWPPAARRTRGPTCAARPTCRKKSASPRSASRTTCWRASRRCSELGLGYLSLDRSTPTLSPGELQRLRLATQIGSNLFGVVYVLDEPSAGLHPADGEALLRRWSAEGLGQFALRGRARPGHDARADWLVDVGPDAR
jgi:excinuclease ABC subunit A